LRTVPARYCEYCGQHPSQRRTPARKVFIGGKWAVGTPGRDGMPFRGDLVTPAAYYIYSTHSTL
jgi:hypothetical protein